MPKASRHYADCETKGLIRICGDFCDKFYGLPDLVDAYDQGIFIPALRENFLAVEAVSIPEVDETYNVARQHAMIPEEKSLNAARNWLKHVTPGLPLKSHQLQFLAECFGKTYFFNASEQGLGKTMMAITSLHMWRCQKILVVIPSGIFEDWKREIEFVDGYRIGYNDSKILNITTGTIKGRKTFLKMCKHLNVDNQASFFIVNYEVLEHIKEELSDIGFDAIVADESWRIKNPKAKTTKAILQLAEKIPHRLALAGTPIGNNIGGLWSQLKFLSPKGVPKSYSAFVDRYAETKDVRIPGRTIRVPCGVSDPVGLVRLFSSYWFRATKATCLDLPPKRHEVVRLSVPKSTRELMKSVTDIGDTAFGKELALTSAATILIRKQQICGGHHPFFDGEEKETRRIDKCPKIEWLKCWASNNLLEYPRARCIVWCNFNAEVERVYEQLCNMGISTAYVTGSVKNKDLEEIKAQFNNRSEGNIQVIVAQTRRMSSGHNLQAADTCIYFSSGYYTIHRQQSEDRAHRIGRDMPVDYIDLLVENSVDEIVYQAVQDGISQSELIARCVAAGELLEDTQTPV